LKDYSKIPDISVSTTGLPGSVMTKVQHYIKSLKTVPVFDVVFPQINVAPPNLAQTSHAGSPPHAAN
jgi:hypothetical protein